MYTGRFAPSPSGPLHLGSLVAALASYIDAKAHQGYWRLRIEDLDTPRCDEQYATLIVETLAIHGMQADGEITYQSKRINRYKDRVDAMLAQGTAYYCQCSRKQIRQQNGLHFNASRTKQFNSGAVRFLNTAPICEFSDRILGNTRITQARDLEDFILLRRDNIYAYNLAVVIDDIDQQITHVVRGDDLLTTTSAQLSLYRYFNASIPCFAHIPVVKHANGLKLSKQNHAPALDNATPIENLLKACRALGLAIIETPRSVKHILQMATQAWQQKHMLGDSVNIK